MALQKRNAIEFQITNNPDKTKHFGHAENIGTFVYICIWTQANSTSLLLESFFFFFDMIQIPLIQNTCLVSKGSS